MICCLSDLPAITTLILALYIAQSLQLKHSTKTAYLDSFNKEQIDYINNNQNYKLENCSAEQIFIFLRHGSRYPNSKYVHKTSDFLDKVRQLRANQKKSANLTYSAAIDDVIVTFDDKPSHGLSELGALEMQQIALRFKKRFPNLFSRENALDSIDIVSSDRDRCIDSGRNFVFGLFGKNSELSNLLINKFVINNTLIRYFDQCHQYIEKIKNKKNSLPNLANFMNGPEMIKLLEEFKSRNRIQELDFRTKILITIFGLCGIEHAHRMKTNWCKLFEGDSELEILSYYSDLKDFWIKSYGNELNYQIVQYLYQDLFANFDLSLKNDSKKKKVLLRFGHAENIIPLLSVLNLFRDPYQLTHDKFSQVKDRYFKTAVMSPFASNLAFVLHKCNNTIEPFRIKILVNEMPLEMLHTGRVECSFESKSECSYSKFSSMLKNFLEIDLDTNCAVRNLENEL
ncbi:multiple inositol polyphosphate phosphatase 1 isoform X1 [Brachionus plicatilis]|uniref:Multiple inositol polyphosphate phosphatase 1 n=1 Tax=Brachionus plicatilis TaxID=10195 RepID=A0A3M7PHJ0_BRAPC|nr:multiple inositol polyphosphate phosphatase 1 isoform X1 [Brachionus plicatilis]